MIILNLNYVLFKEIFKIVHSKIKYVFIFLMNIMLKNKKLEELFIPLLQR